MRDTETAFLRRRVKYLSLALLEATECSTCHGTGKMQIECYACLSGEPEKCTCGTMELETCGECQGNKRNYHGSQLVHDAVDLVIVDKLSE